MKLDRHETESCPSGMAAGVRASEGGDDRMVSHSLRDALADTEVREVSLAEFLAELKKCGRQLA